MRELKSIKSEMKKVTTDTTEMQKIIKNYYKQLYANKMVNLEEMGKFSETYNIPKQNKEKIENIKRQITVLKLKP